jgi:hypothetical protein
MTATPNPTLMTTTSLEALISSLTPAERAHGRFLRAPDHGEGGDAGDDSNVNDQGDGDKQDDGADDKGSDKDGADEGDSKGDDKQDEADADKSLMGKAGEKADGEKDKGPDLPEKYELAAPEGFTIDEDLLAAADPVFRELGLGNDQANKLMPLIPAFAEKLVAAQNDAHQAMAAGWAKEAKADKELGGANWAETETLVARALDTFGAPEGSEFRNLLNETKLGNHPEMIRMFRSIGEKIGEGGDFVRADGGAPVKQDRTAILYPDDVKKEGAN